MIKKGILVAAAFGVAAMTYASAGATEYSRESPQYRQVMAGGLRAAHACENAEKNAMKQACIIGEKPIRARVGSCDCTETANGYLCSVTVQCPEKVPAE